MPNKANTTIAQFLSMLKKHALALALLFAPLCVLFFPVFVLQKTVLPLDQLNTMFLPYSAEQGHARASVYNHFLTDAWAQVYPYKVRQQAALRHGELFSWNPSILGGHPQYASTSFTHFDPTNLVLLLFEMPTAFHVQMFVKLLIAGVAMYALLTVLGLQPLINGVFGGAYMLNSLFITTLQHQWITGALCWMPLCCLFLHRCFASKLASVKILHTLAAALMLALAFMGGSLQTSALCGLVVLVVCIGYGWNAGETVLSRVAIPLVVAAYVGVVAVACSAVMWLPSVELFLNNVNPRAGGKEFSLLNGLKALPLLTSFVIPELIGSVRGFDLAKVAGADMNDFNAFVGFGAWLFGAWGAVVLWKKQITARPYILLMALGLVLPLFTPAYKFLYHRCFLMYVLGVCVVGALAFERLMARSDDDSEPFQQEVFVERFMHWHRFMVRAFAALVALLLVANVVLVWKHDRIYGLVRMFVEKLMESGVQGNSQMAAGNREWMLGRVDAFLQHYLLWSPAMFCSLVFVAAVLVLVWLWGNRRYSETAFTIGLGGLNAAHLLVFAFSWLPMIDMNTYPLFPQSPSMQVLQADSSGAENFRVLPIWNAESQRVFQPNTLDIYGVSMIQGYESLFPPNASKLAPSFEGIPTTQQLRLGGLVGVKYYASSASYPLLHPALRLVYGLYGVDGTRYSSPTDMMKTNRGVYLYENKLWRGRAYMAYRYKVLPSADEQLRQMLDTAAGFDGSTVLLFNEPQKQVNIMDSAAAPVQNAVHITLAENNRVRLAVQTARAGYLVLADTYYAGWRVFVNEQEQSMMKANYVLRAVCVPAGTSEVEFRFEPVLAKLGGWISVGSVVLVCGILVMMLVRSSHKA
jgi:hypothetical protein